MGKIIAQYSRIQSDGLNTTHEVSSHVHVDDIEQHYLKKRKHGLLIPDKWAVRMTVSKMTSLYSNDTQPHTPPGTTDRDVLTTGAHR